jgi:hypothetical protein
LRKNCPLYWDLIKWPNGNGHPPTMDKGWELQSTQKILSSSTSRNKAIELASNIDCWGTISYVFADLIDRDNLEEDWEYKYHGQKQVMEFNQHEATLDMARVEHWIKTCAGIVQFAIDSKTPALLEYLSKHITDKDYAPDAFLQHIGLGAEAEFYAKNMYKHPLQGTEEWTVARKAMNFYSGEPDLGVEKLKIIEKSPFEEVV